MHGWMVRSAIVALALATGPAHAQSEPLLQAARAIEDRQAEMWLRSVAAQLQLTDAQKPAFAGYEAAIRTQAELKAAHRSAGLFENTADLPPAPAALGQRLVQLQERAAALGKVQAAAATLYAELSAQQRIAFDFLATTPTGIGSDEAG